MPEREEEKYSHQVLDSKLCYKGANIGRNLPRYGRSPIRGWKADQMPSRCSQLGCILRSKSMV